MIFRTLRAVKFLFMGPVILGFLVLINWMTSPGHWWVQWAAPGIGIARVISLFRVFMAVLVAGGIAALVAALKKQPLTPFFCLSDYINQCCVHDYGKLTI